MSNCNGNNGNGISGGNSFVRHISEFVGETVTIFTTSGGASGCGFTGTILDVNCNFVRLVTHRGIAPSNPLSESICGDCGYGPRGVGGDRNGMGDNGVGLGPKGGCGPQRPYPTPTVGSVCDIPIDRIAAFCHNAV
ncbi:MAG: putative rane protein [Herbinix sp.]|nr:putative rane protein [Herbinix sp.]